ncbi:hypothetical protein N7456_003716 [Penicillium angulare]|uniref:Uncharacterized protein n=1 Tax=Penicillium angulare TaxID=116970 RepID=A0A9W9KII3_9EURO|nr:hypothetical protein N7456_003716 [Penicillium angulare]
MSWTKQENYWSRPFDCHDELFHVVRRMGAEINREHWQFMVNVKISFAAEDDRIGSDIERRLRQAWKALRFLHPGIAVEVYENEAQCREKKYHPVQTHQELEDFCNETFFTETTSSSADEFFSQRGRASRYITLHWIPETRQIAFISSHAHWDGRGALFMLHEYLSVLENPIIPTTLDGTEAENFVPSLNTVIGMPEKSKPEWEESAAEIMQHFMDVQPSIGCVPPGDTKSLPAESKRLETILPPDMSKSLFQAARKENITISTAVETAGILALTAMNNEGSQPEYYASWAAFDLRKYCPPPFDGPVHAPSIRLTSLPLIVKSQASWSEMSRAISELNRTPWDVNESDMMFVRDPFVRNACGIFLAAMSQPDLPPSTEPFFSSLGVYEDYVKHEYGPFTVEDVSLAVHILPPSICLHIWTWRGSLHLSACYNTAYYTTDYVQDYLDTTKDILLKNLL